MTMMSKKIDIQLNNIEIEEEKEGEEEEEIKENET